MADDGMLVNFAAPENSLGVQQKFRGGNWRDRLTARKAGNYHQKKAAKPQKQAESDSVGLNGSSSAPDRELSSQDDEGVIRSAKRQRVDDSFRPDAALTADERTNRPLSRPKQVVSSLFTHNPAPKEVSAVVHDAAGFEAIPSNAPLTSELDTFTSLGISIRLANQLVDRMNLKAPTAIQKAAITQLLQEDTDAMIQAETGSGKTLAYLVPIVHRIMEISQQMKEGSKGMTRQSGLLAVVLAPTRELARQISTILEKLLGCAKWIVSGAITGGEDKNHEKYRIRKGMHILVATPGRLSDHLDNTEALDASKVRWLVLDEGDRLTEFGFLDEVQKIVSRLNLRMKAATAQIPGLPAKRTTILCSATLGGDVDRLSQISLKNPVHIEASSDVSASAADASSNTKGFHAPAQLRQEYTIAPAKLRLVTLLAVLKQTFAARGTKTVKKAIVFLSCTDSVDLHFETLKQSFTDGEEDEEEVDDEKSKAKAAGTSNQSTLETQAAAPSISNEYSEVTEFRLHGNIPQKLRTSTLKEYTDSKTPSVLLCTDVAARGLDLPNVDVVIEYDPPFSKDDHLHRVGRTARAGRDGRAMIFLLPGEEEGYVSVLEEGRPEGSAALIRYVAEDHLKRAFGGKGKDWEAVSTDLQVNIERWALSDPKNLEMARAAFQSHVRGYATHVAAERHIFNIKSLHLGHLAKAFALRDAPAKIGVPGMRGSVKSSKNAKGKAIRAKAVAGRDNQDRGYDKSNETEDAAKKMKEKIKMQRMMGAGTEEFNLG